MRKPALHKLCFLYIYNTIPLRPEPKIIFSGRTAQFESDRGITTRMDVNWPTQLPALVTAWVEILDMEPRGINQCR